MKTNQERYGQLCSDFESAIIDRLKAASDSATVKVKDKDGVESEKVELTWTPSAPALRVAAIGAWKEVQESETDPIDGELAANVIFGVLAVNESAFTQKLERKADAGTLPFKIKRGAKATARGYTSAS